MKHDGLKATSEPNHPNPPHPNSPWHPPTPPPHPNTPTPHPNSPPQLPNPTPPHPQPPPPPPFLSFFAPPVLMPHLVKLQLRKLRGLRSARRRLLVAHAAHAGGLHHRRPLQTDARGTHGVPPPPRTKWVEPIVPPQKPSKKRRTYGHPKKKPRCLEVFTHFRMDTQNTIATA